MLQASRSAESARAERIVRAFLDVAAAEGLEPVELRAKGYGGGSARTRLKGWYLRADRTVAIDVDGRFYVLSKPLTVRERLFGAAPDAVFTLSRTHWATEEHLRASGMGFTFLRDSFYADFLPDLAVEGVIAGPAGTGRVGAVARADVARSAAAVIRDLLTSRREHAAAVYELTGPEALTLAEAAAIITETTGRSTVYRDQTLEEAYASRSVYDAPEWEIDAWVSTYTAIASGSLDRVTDDVERLTGRRPLGLAELLAGEC